MSFEFRSDLPLTFLRTNVFATKFSFIAIIVNTFWLGTFQKVCFLLHRLHSVKLISLTWRQWTKCSCEYCHYRCLVVEKKVPKYFFCKMRKMFVSQINLHGERTNFSIQSRYKISSTRESQYKSKIIFSEEFFEG